MKKLLILPLLALLLLAGCTKEEPINNSGGIVFWQTKTTAQTMTNLGVTTYKVYVAGKYVGSRSTAEYYDIAPDCDGTALKYTHNLGTADQATVSYELYDENNTQLESSSITIKKNICLQWEWN